MTIPISIPGQAGDPVFLDASGKLPAVDASQLTSTAISTAASGTVNFGSTGEENTASVTVSASWVTTASKLVCTVSGFSPDHDAEDPALEAITAYTGNIVNGVSFDVILMAPLGTWGRYTVSVVGA